ncbi:MAG: helicase-associated domain-containing protein [Pseudonocardiales bacterium]
MPATPTPLAQWLRCLDDDALAALLSDRPDLAVPAPANSTVLAIRAGIPASVARTCEDLDRFTLAVLTALVVAGADSAPVHRRALTRLLGSRITARHTTRALDTLRRRALAWGGDDELAVVPAAREITGSHPGGLGRPAPQLVGLDVNALLAELPESELGVLRVLANGSPIGETRDAVQVLSLDRARTPVARLLARGLLRRIDSGTVELPAQIGIAMRGDQPLGHLEPTEPELPARVLDPSTVDSTAAGAVLSLLRHVENLLAAWSQEPPTVLRSGGLGVREVRRTARVLDVEDSTVVLLAEVTVAAGLVTCTEDLVWLPTVATDAWLAASPERRWAVLADAWLELPRLPRLAWVRPDKDKAKDRALAPLSEELRRPRAAAQRRWVLEALAELPAGKAIKRVDELAAVLAWRAPRRGGRLRDEVVGWTVEEATALGIVALGAVSTAGRVLLTEGAAAATATMAAALPKPVDHVLVQADRTVVAPGPLEPDLARQIGLVADVESAGGATVYRITEATVRRALDAGRSAAELHELFRTRSRTPVPQSLSYLIDDVARRHGRLRGGACASFLRCDDEALLAELLAHPIAARTELRRLAHTVASSPVPLPELLGELRSAGFSPVAEGADGQLIDLRAEVRRAPVRTRAIRPPALPRTLSAEQLATLVRGMRAGDAAAMAN